MNSLSQYNIAFKGLSVGKHVFEFVIDDQFFDAFQGSLVEQGLVNVKLTLEKQSSLMTFWFDIKGTVKVPCDLCLEMYDQPIESHERIFVRLGETENMEGDDLIWVSTQDYQFNVAQLIYEFIGLAIPIKKVHPLDENGNSTCDPLMIEKLNKYMVREDEQQNPVWKDLKKLLDNE